MIVRIPSPLRSYTDGSTQVTGCGATVDEVLLDLDAKFPGIRFRMIDEQHRLRRHMRVFVNDEMVRNLADPVNDTDEVTILQALSGG